MTPSQTLLSEQAELAKHLFTQGYPLWNPDPCLLPQDRRNVGLRIGDVGTVDERGRFDFFFNILEDLPGNLDDPPIFPEIQDDDAFCYGAEDISPRQVVSSPETPWEVDQSDVLSDDLNITTTRYSASLSDDGAHIILPQGAQSSELASGHRLRGLFENLARERGADWLERFRDRLGSPRSNSIYLLTGLHKTCSWSLASFRMRTASNVDPVRVDCTLTERNGRVVREESVWRPQGRFKHRVGPPSDRQGRHNQTVFVRGITITPNLSERGREMETSESDIIIQHVPQFAQLSHPSEIINQHLFTKEPSAKIAVTHDSQWIEMLKLLEKGQSWTQEDLENHLEALVPEHYSVVIHDDAVYLREKEHGLPTHSS